MAIPRVTGPWAGTTAHPVAGPTRPSVLSAEYREMLRQRYYGPRALTGVKGGQDGIPVERLLVPPPAGWRGPRTGAFPRHPFTPSPAGGGWRGARTGIPSPAPIGKPNIMGMRPYGEAEVYWVGDHWETLAEIAATATWAGRNAKWEKWKSGKTEREAWQMWQDLKAEVDRQESRVRAAEEHRRGERGETRAERPIFPPGTGFGITPGSFGYRLTREGALAEMALHVDEINMFYKLAREAIARGDTAAAELAFRNQAEASRLYESAARRASRARR